MYQPTIDLAGEVCFRSNSFQTKERINYLIDRYFSYTQLRACLKDLPRDPQPRKWSAIGQDINPEQVIGLELDVFLSITKGALDPEGSKRLISYLLSQINTILPVSYKLRTKTKSNLKTTFKRTMSALNWQSWSLSSQGELIYTFIWILKRMWHWRGKLTPEYLHYCCSTPEFFGNNSIEYD